MALMPVIRFIEVSSPFLVQRCDENIFNFSLDMEYTSCIIFIRRANNRAQRKSQGRKQADMSINSVNISGNLTRDPELRNTTTGTSVLSFSVAVNDRRKNSQTGEWEDAPNFVDVTMFGSRAEALSRFLHKGSKVAIEGKLRYSRWERDGQTRSKLEVVANEIEFMSLRNNNDGGGHVDTHTAPAQSSSYDEDDVPF